MHVVRWKEVWQEVKGLDFLTRGLGSTISPQIAGEAAEFWCKANTQGLDTAFGDGLDGMLGATFANRLSASKTSRTWTAVEPDMTHMLPQIYQRRAPFS